MVFGTVYSYQSGFEYLEGYREDGLSPPHILAIYRERESIIPGYALGWPVSWPHPRPANAYIEIAFDSLGAR